MSRQPPILRDVPHPACLLICAILMAFSAQTLAYARYVATLGPKIEFPSPGREVTVTDTETGQVYSLTILGSGEILHGEDTYHFVYTDEKESIVYPDGSRCTNFLYGTRWDENNRMLTGDEKGPYLPTFVLIRAIESVEDAKWKPKGGLIFGGVVLLALGLLTCLKPRLAHQLDVGWKYKDLEPSDLNLGLRALGGAIAAIIGLILAIIGIVG